MTGSDDSRAQVKRRFIDRRGFWSEIWDATLELDPGYVDAYVDYSTVASKRGLIDPKLRELISVALDTVAMHMYEAGARIHIRGALERGATPAELMEVLELCVPVGAQTALLGARVLAELTGAGEPAPSPLEEEFRAAHGYWSGEWARLADSDPDYVRAYIGLTSRPGTLDPKTKELILLAVNVCVTHLDEAAVRAHMAAALRHGATPDEILALLEIVATVGVHSVTFGGPILAEEVARVLGTTVRPVAIPAGQLDEGTAQTLGMQRRVAVDASVGATRVWGGRGVGEAGKRSLKHHHGDAETCVYIVSGCQRVWFGENYEEYVEACAGDFLYVPAWLPHYEENVHDEDSLTILFRSPDNIVVNIEEATPENTAVVHVPEAALAEGLPRMHL